MFLPVSRERLALREGSESLHEPTTFSKHDSSYYSSHVPGRLDVMDAQVITCMFCEAYRKRRANVRSPNPS